MRRRYFSSRKNNVFFIWGDDFVYCNHTVSKLNSTDLEHYRALATDIDGLILRTPMPMDQLEQWIEQIVRQGFPKDKLIAHMTFSYWNGNTYVQFILKKVLKN